MKSLTKTTYPEGFTYLIAEVADIAMKAIQQPDPYEYLQYAATAESLQIARMRRGLTREEYDDPQQRRQFRLDVVRTKLARDLALHLIAAFHRYDRLRATASPPAAARPDPRNALAA